MDQYIQSDSELRFLSHYLWLLCIWRWIGTGVYSFSMELCYYSGVKMWLHSDADSAP